MAKASLDQALFTEEPIIMHEGALVVMDLFKRDSKYMAAYALAEKKIARMNDVHLYLYLLYSSRSMYRKMETDQRKGLIYSDQVKDPDWLKEFVQSVEMTDLEERYRYMVQSPADRMMDHLLTNIKRFLEELAAITPDSDTDMNAMVKRADQLYESYERIQKQMRGEQERQRRAGYNPRLFEDPANLPTARAAQ